MTNQIIVSNRKTLKDMFINLLQMNKSTNKFLILMEQLKEFDKIANSSYFKNFTNWFKFFSQKGSKNLPILFSPFKKNHQSIFDDQNIRSDFIVNYMQNNPTSQLITMDGHGRLIYSIISKLQDLSSFKRSKKIIHLLDIDNLTNNFHKKMFPTNIFGKQIRIPECQDILELNSTFLEKNNISHPLLYLNFCGINCCSTKNEKGNERVIKFIKQWINKQNNIMLSVSLRPHGFKTHHLGKLTTYGMLQEFNLELISRRSNFVTYFITS